MIPIDDLFFLSHIFQEKILHIVSQGKHILTTRNQCFYNQSIVFHLLYVFIWSSANVCIRRQYSFTSITLTDSHSIEFEIRITGRNPTVPGVM